MLDINKDNDYFGKLSVEEFKKLIPTLGDNLQLYNIKDFTHHTDHLINLLASLKPKYTYVFMQTIDLNYPGLSIHFVMEARHNLSKADALFMYRIAYHIYIHPEKELFMPMRRRLIMELLFNYDVDLNDEVSETYREQLEFSLTGLKKAISDIHSLSFLHEREKRKISNILFNASFEKHYQTFIQPYVEKEDNDLMLSLEE